MSLDQVHEQNNAVLKGKGGVTDLFNRTDESGLIRWEVCGPELARIVSDLENEFSKSFDDQAGQSSCHHDDNKG